MATNPYTTNNQNVFNPQQMYQQWQSMFQGGFNRNNGTGDPTDPKVQFMSIDPKKVSGDLLARLNPYLRSQIGLMNKYQPLREQMLSRGLGILNNNSRQADINKVNNANVENFMSNARNASQMLRSQGIDQTGGLFTDAMNQANVATSNFASQVYSPEEQLNNILRSLGLINDTTSSGFNLFSQIMGTMPPPEPPGDPLGGLGGVLGAIAGSIF